MSHAFLWGVVFFVAATSPASRCITLTVPSSVPSNLSRAIVAGMRYSRDLTLYEGRNMCFASSNVSLPEPKCTGHGFYFSCNANGVRSMAK